MDCVVITQIGKTVKGGRQHDGRQCLSRVESSHTKTREAATRLGVQILRAIWNERAILKTKQLRTVKDGLILS